MKIISNISIRKRLVIYFIISVFIPTTIVTITVYKHSKEIIRKKIDESNQRNLETISEAVTRRIESIYDISTLITYNPKVIDILSKENNRSAIAIVNEITELETLINGYYLFGQSYTGSDYMFPKIYMVNRPEYQQYKISDKILSINEIEDEVWYKRMTKEAFSIPGTDKKEMFSGTISTIKIVRRLYRTNDPFDPFAALLTIDINESYFADLLERLKISHGCSSYIIDEKGFFMVGEEDENTEIIRTFMNETMTYNDGYHSKVIIIDGQEMLVSVKNIHKIHWNIITISPLSELNKEMIKFNKIMTIVIIGCIIIAALVALLLSNDLSKPIEQLVDSMKTVDHKNLHINLEYKRSDEFGFLIGHYKEMMERIRELIDKLYKSEIKKNRAELKMKEAEMEALMAQINPHFLYNTLDSINWLAIKYGVDDISAMVKSLSKIFRYTLNGTSVITIEEELQHVRSYMVLQQNRFKEMLEYYIDIEESIKACPTIKLILQPLVENAIVHGFQNDLTLGFIWIIGRRVDEEKIEITVSDNGQGGDVNALNQRIIALESHDSSIGLCNVNRRIRNFFGEDCGLTFSLNKEGGMTVTVTIKAVEIKENTYVENDNSR